MMPDDGISAQFSSLTTHLRLQGAADLARGLCDLKAVHDPRNAFSVAERLFLRAWAALAAGDDAGDVGLAITARAVAAVTLGAIDDAILADGGLSTTAIRDIFFWALAAAPWKPTMPLRRGFEKILLDAEPPPFARALAQQPRAGATACGKPRIMLPEPETHAGHCLSVAVLGLLIAEDEDAGINAFLAGLAHHLHNAALPDAGFAGEMLLGEHLAPVMVRFRERALDSLPPLLGARSRSALTITADTGTAAGRAFHAADVIDRVAQMGFHARAGAFRVEHATGELGLVHEGPLQAFQHAVLARAGLA